MTNRELEQSWISFQFVIAACRPTLGPLYDAALKGRSMHTFYPDSAPRTLLVRAVEGITAGAPNGVPDAFFITTSGSYAARQTSVLAASAIILHLDSAIQKLAVDLGQANGLGMMAGEEMLNSGESPVKASTLIWAGANNVRHVDEWYEWRRSYTNPRTKVEREKREQHRRSMEPIAAVLGISTPITENAAFEVFQRLVAVNETRGEYDRLELHILKIGQELIARAGYLDPIIGVTVNEYVDAGERGLVPSEHLHVSDGVMRAASALPDSDRLGSVAPMSAVAHEPK